LAEKHLVKALPKMSKAAYDEELTAAFSEHLQQTQTHVERLGQVFGQLGKKAQGKKCKADTDKKLTGISENVNQQAYTADEVDA